MARRGDRVGGAPIGRRPTVCASCSSDRVGADVVGTATRDVRSSASRWVAGCPTARQPVVAFGAAAKLTHPATGYSVAASLRAAPRVAAAIADGGDARHVWEAVWPPALRRTRRLHDYGLEVLLGLGPASWRRSSTPSSTCRSTCGRRTCASTARRRRWSGRCRLCCGASVVDAPPSRGEPVRRSLIDLRTASTQPTATAIEKMNHCTA